METSKLLSKFNNGKEIKVSFQYLSDDIIILVNSLLIKILSNIDLIFLCDTIVTIVRELILNAFKANSKRVFFNKRKLDINNLDDYYYGMDKFKKEILNKMDSIRSDILNSDYRAIIKFKTVQHGIKITVSHNTPILPIEFERIKYRIKKARDSNFFTDIYDIVYDPSEGAGLGIILIIFLLKKSGIDLNNYQLIQDGNSFHSSLVIPKKFKPDEITSIIKDKIIEKVEELPTFPENIVELKSLCKNPEVTINKVASKIIHDPSLTAELLKISNSAGFITGKKIENINEAIMTIGLKNVDSILTVAAARKILDTRYKKFEQIWSHCNQVAFFARYIAHDKGFSSIIDNVFIAGLLHDIGKIVLLSTDSSLVNLISKIVENRKMIKSTILEEISIGISHSTIGALIAKKWKFPGYLIETIKNHHSPLNTNERYRDLALIVYLANMLAGIKSQKYNFQYIETEILEKFKLNNKNKLNRYNKMLTANYDEHYSLITG